MAAAAATLRYEGGGGGGGGEDKTLLDNGCIIMKRIQLGEGREEKEEEGTGGGPVNKHRGKQAG